MIKQLGIMLLASILLGLVFQTLNPPVPYASDLEHISHIMEHIIAYAGILITISFAVALIPRCAYWIMKKKRVPDLNILMWSIWILLALVILANQVYSNYLRSEIKTTNIEKSNRPIAYKIYQKVSKSIYMIYSKDQNNRPLASGSAVAVTEDFLATNCHVISDGDYFTIVIHDTEKKGILYSQHDDLCIVSVQNEKFSPVNIRFSKEVEIGEDVYTIGNPHHLEKSISRGIISNKFNDGGIITLQTDANILPGSSGGGLFDHNGKLIGITTLHINNERIGFVIPTETITAALLEPRVNPKPEKTNSNDAAEQKPLNNPSDLATPPPTQANNVITRIGYYGKSEIALIKWNKECFIGIPGRYQPDKPISLAIWFPNTPNGIFIFSRITNAEDAVKFMDKIAQTNNTKYITSKSFVFFNNQLFGLALISLNNINYPVYIFALKDDLTEKLVTSEYFIGQFYNYSHQPGMTTIKFGLDGFTEALAAYNKFCNKDE